MPSALISTKISTKSDKRHRVTSEAVTTGEIWIDFESGFRVDFCFYFKNTQSDLARAKTLEKVMRYEYIMLAIILIMMWQNFSLRQQLRQLWQVMDKQKYVTRYLELLATSKDQTQALKALRTEFKELGLLQAYEVSQIAHNKSS